MAHAKYSPSSAYRWLRCAYSATVAHLYPNTESAASKEGTRMHKKAEQHLLEGTDSEDYRMQIYLDEVRSYEGEMLVEKEVRIFGEECWGTSDAIVVCDDKLVVIDLKWGKSTVQPHENPQMMLYGIGAIQELEAVPEVVQLVIVQPNATQGSFVKAWETTTEYLMGDFREKAQRAIERGNSGHAPCIAGRWCYFCPAKLHCSEYLYLAGIKKGVDTE